MEQNENARERPSEAVQDEILAAILQKIGGPIGAQSIGSDGTAQQSKAPSRGVSDANPFGDILSSVLANPDMLSKLPSLIASAKPIIELLGKMGTAPASSIDPTGTGAQASSDTVNAMARRNDATIQSKGSDSRTALLCAMKPYLSEDRRNAVDYIVKLSRLGEILKSL